MTTPTKEQKKMLAKMVWEFYGQYVIADLEKRRNRALNRERLGRITNER